DVLNKLVKGMILPGTVSSIVDFGAFVDLGGIDGLVHISELSWSHVNHPSEVVAVGDKVEVQVLDVDMSRERISLGLKQTQEDPWKQLVKDFTVGVIVDGKVTKIVPFGAFVEIGDNVEGLVHISEMARGHVEKPEDVVRVADEIKVKVMDVDLDRRRISLSIRAANEELGLPDAIPAPSEDDEDVADEATETIEASEAVETEAVETVEAEAEAVEETVEADVVEAEEVVEVEPVVEAEVEAEEVVEDAVDADVDKD
ncbi:MAG: S1 RNA-binding domain-containing protein, partial [Coriobacteriia bacterium]